MDDRTEHEIETLEEEIDILEEENNALENELVKCTARLERAISTLRAWVEYDNCLSGIDIDDYWRIERETYQAATRKRDALLAELDSESEIDNENTF